MAIQKKHSSLTNILVALFLVTAICVSLLVATPVAAISVTLTVPSSVRMSGTLRMEAQVNIENGEALPITSLKLEIFKNVKRVAEVKFNVDGDITGQMAPGRVPWPPGSGGTPIFAWFTVVQITAPYSSTDVTGYAHGFGYDGSVYGYWTGNWPSGSLYYGHGYGSNQSTQMAYKIGFYTGPMTKGNYTVQLSVITTPSPRTYVSDKYAFSIEEALSNEDPPTVPPKPTATSKPTPTPTSTLTPTPRPPPTATPTPTPTMTPVTPVTQNVANVVNAGGVFTQDVSLSLTPPAETRQVGSATLNIDSETTGLTGGGQPLSQISMQQLTSAPAPPAGDNIIGLPYDFKPDGATFSPPAELVLTGIPSDAVVMYWNGSAWIELEKNASGNWLVPHFTTFAVFARAKPQPGSPAAFKVASLRISPAEANLNQSVDIVVNVSNTGGTSGEYTATLKLNNTVKEEKKVTVDGGSTREVVFTITGAAAGNYSVDVNGLTSAFTVKAAEVVPPKKDIPVIVWILAGVAVVLVIGIVIWRRRSSSD